MSKAEKLNIRIVKNDVELDTETFHDIMVAHIVVNNRHMHIAQMIFSGERVLLLDWRAIKEMKRILKKQRWIETRIKSGWKTRFEKKVQP